MTDLSTGYLSLSQAGRIEMTVTDENSLFKQAIYAKYLSKGDKTHLLDGFYTPNVRNTSTFVYITYLEGFQSQ
jgi:hypothetical protein